MSLPKVLIRGDNLFVETDFFHQVMSLFSYCRVIHVSKRRKQIEIRVKKWWSWERLENIPFSNIAYIDINRPSLRDDYIYDVILITKKPYRRIDLWRFSVDEEEDSEICRKQANDCAELIAESTGTHFGLIAKTTGAKSDQPKLLDTSLTDFKDKYVCMDCGHEIHPTFDSFYCAYCGGKNIRIK